MTANRQDASGLNREVHGIIYGQKDPWIRPRCRVRIICRLLLCIALGVFFLSSNLGAFELSGEKWPEATTTFHVDIPGADGLSNTSFEEAAEKWNSATVFNFVVIPNSFVDPCRNPNLLSPMNGVKFAVTVCGDAWGQSTLAISKSWYAGYEITQSGIIFNSNKDWDVYSGSWEKPGYHGISDFRRVAVHELGHTIGLGHEDYVPAIMGTYAGDYEDPQPDDIEGVNILYLGCSPPSIPDNIIYPSSDGDGSFTIRWSSSNGATSYTFQRATDSSFNDAKTVYSGSSTSYSQMLGSGIYFYRVRATNSCGSSGYRNGPAISIYMSPPPDDPDNDGLDYAEEVNKKTDPNDHDTDGDGLNDDEDAAPLDPDADKNGIVDQSS